jgi:hypothetical protein
MGLGIGTAIICYVCMERISARVMNPHEHCFYIFYIRRLNLFDISISNTSIYIYDSLYDTL